MAPKFKSIIPVLISAVCALLHGTEVERAPVSIGLQYEFGNIEQGTYQNPESGINTRAGDEWLDHFGGHLFQSVTVDQRTGIMAGIAGSFQFRKPEEPGSEFSKSSRSVPFLAPVALLSHSFGDLEHPWCRLEFGSLVFKYNPNARVLGEYLFRSRPYPTLLFTGGYTVVANAKAYLRGFHANFKYQGLSVDFLLTTEMSLPPLYDFSPSLVLKYSLLDGFAEIGAGVMMRSLIQIDKDRTTKEHPNHGYFKYNDTWYTTNNGYYDKPEKFYTAYLRDTVGARIADEISTQFPIRDSIGEKGLSPEIIAALNSHGYDPEAVIHIAAKRDSLSRVKTFVSSVVENDSLIEKGVVKYYTYAGTTLMGMFTLDLQKLFPMSFLSREDLKIFCEVNLLGVKNYPIFFENRMDRLPVVVGINLPTFKLLDLLSLEVEVFNSPHLNNSYHIGKFNDIIPFQPDDPQDVMSWKDYNDATGKDNIKWAVQAEKSITSTLMFRIQAGRTHLQLTGTSFDFGPQFGAQEVTTFPDDWYWMIQFAWGI